MRNQVALFGTDSFEEDPTSVTLGVDYTPVPLVTIGAGYKQGNSDQNEVTANISFDYPIGTPLSKQRDASAVADMCTLAGSRMDFVDRNNDIVLEYRHYHRHRTSMPVTITSQTPINYLRII
ncbi:inverse autotransporter beta domain-containing protein [Rahnella sp. BIGb0603]|uniref:inverse autotransporter beta domain-containing protein n=1 Tax=Rahnella sp. BIGb0603 TaxID=2940612 RepID=UPI002168CCB4|nr:inverse autotransporter beta domain-containing protein [Rahnella sp. BIGb0603]